MIIDSDFKPAWWLRNSHAQTLFATLTRRIKAPVDRVERFELPDGDFIDLAWAENGLSPDAPLVILLHGLGGGVNSRYVPGLLREFNQCGWRGVLMHFRGASHEPNRLLRAYHSGDTADVDYLLNALNAREPHVKKAIVGVSLGGNVLLKWLGEKGPQSLVQAAVAVSVPFQLRMAADRMNKGMSRIYQAHLLKKLRQVFSQKKQQFDPLPLFENLQSLRCFWTFDEEVTAPLHGFNNVHTYYRQASSRQYLRNISTPTLVIHALDDPFMTPEAIPTEKELSDNVTLEISTKGGHVGFIAGPIMGKPVYWLDRRIPAYLKAYLD